MRKVLIPILLVLFLLPGCNFPTAKTPDTNQVDTQVAQMLTSMPTAAEITPEATHLSATATMVTFTSTATSTLVPTATPTIIPTTTSTQAPSDPAISLGTPTWTNPGDWKGFYFDSTGSEVKYILSDNDLELIALNANGWYGWSLTYIKGTNFYLEGTFKVNACSGLDRYGLVFRAPDTSQGYFYQISCDGQYAVRKWIGSGFSDNDIISWSTSSDILAGSNQVNRLGVMANGNQLSFYANGKLLSSASDDTFVSEGIFGAFIASSDTPELTVDVQSMKFWKLP
jgi:hypothetical protein